jgi:hypothetical protein
LDEHILSASLAGDEAEALFGVEPFYCAGLLDGAMPEDDPFDVVAMKI